MKFDNIVKDAKFLMALYINSWPQETQWGFEGVFCIRKFVFIQKESPQIFLPKNIF